MIRLKNILVATDFGEASEAALAYGRTLARTFDARLHVMHVVGSTSAWAGAEGYAFDAGELQAEMEEGARKALAALIRDDDRRELNAETVLRVSGTPALAIVSYARDANVDLIVMGTHGRGGMAHLFMGSVAERVVRTASCPVLTVRHPEHEFVLPDALQVVTHARA
jgi:nucleotide-binding universal stress UspA family protein